MRFPSRKLWSASAESILQAPVWSCYKWTIPQAPPIGTQGTVMGVDDIGSIMVAWDNGSGLSVVLGEDLCRKVKNTSDGSKQV